MAADAPDRLNVIVEGSKIKGDFVAESNVRIDGEIQGNVTSTSKVVVGATGFINGNLICVDADIEGRIEGVLKVENRLSLKSKANILGEIQTGSIQIEEGAKFSGKCQMSNQKTVSVNAVADENVVY